MSGRPMKRADLIEVATCGLCHRRIGETSSSQFYRVTVEQHGILLDAVKRHAGLEQLVGSPAIAAALGPDEDMTAVTMPAAIVTVCMDCSNDDLVDIVHAIQRRA